MKPLDDASDLASEGSPESNISQKSAGAAQFRDLPTLAPNDEATFVARRRGAALAGHAGDVVTARGYLIDPHPSVRSTALAALARMSALTVPEVANALQDSDASVRRRAVTLAIAFAEVDIVPLLDDEDRAVAEQAAWALGERAEQAGTAAIERLSSMATNDSDPLCREAAVAALGAIGDDRGLDAILSATTDKPAVRRRAVLALAPFDDPRCEAALARALEDRDWQVRQAAEDMLAED